MMDTPEKTQIPTPISKFEDSPVFSYINEPFHEVCDRIVQSLDSLSPIKQDKSIHTSQTFNSPTFASPLSVFTSPSISLHGETRFSKRNHFTGLSKYELSECGTEENKSDRVPNSVQPSDLCFEKLGLSLGNSAIEDSTKAHNEHPESVIDFPKTLKYDHNGPDSPRCDVLHTNNVLEGTPASGVQFTGDGSKEKHGSLVNEIKLEISCQIDQTKEAAGCHWKEFITDGADPLVLDSSIIDGSSERQDPQTVDSGTTSCTLTSVRLPEKDTNDLQRTELAGPNLSLEKKGMNVHVLLSSEVANLKETEQAREILSTTSLDKQIIRDLNAEADNEVKNMETSCKPTFQQQRSIRRLVFEISGVHKKISALNCGSSSSVSSQPESKVYAFEEKHKVSIKPPTSSSSKLAGIGLHLNALASTSNNHSLTKHDSLASRVQLITMPSSNVSDDSLISDQKSVDMSLNLNSLDRDSGPHDNGVQVMEDATSSFGYSEGLHQSSPKKKRHKSEHAGGSEACKRCNCKKTKCLKLYCECFAAGLYCVWPCYCQDCFNRPIHENTVLETRKLIESRNPLAFAPKVIRGAESVPEFEEEYNKTPASARHKRGCNCRKSSCLKKYCECFQGGVGCSIGCRCEGCKNTFGRKYGTEEVEGKESVVCETSLNNLVEKGEEEHSGPAVLPTTPSLEAHRPPVNLPLSSIKPPHASLAVGSSPQLQDEFNTTPASARHKRGCNCQKSSCLKKYCECFQGGVGCSIGCRCEGCKNAFGQKYGTEDPELEGEKTVTTETLRDNIVEKVEQQHSNPDVPITPSLETHRPMAAPPLSFNMKPPHASPLRIGSSPQLRPGFKLNQSEFFSRMSKVEKRLQMTPKDETPEILKDNFSPTTETRSSSSNFKTVSPPHRNYAPSPAWRSGRKLILRSIPALPSLDQREKQ